MPVATSRHPTVCPPSASSATANTGTSRIRRNVSAFATFHLDGAASATGPSLRPGAPRPRRRAHPLSARPSPGLHGTVTRVPYSPCVTRTRRHARREVRANATLVVVGAVVVALLGAGAAV